MSGEPERSHGWGQVGLVLEGQQKVRIVGMRMQLKKEGLGTGERSYGQGSKANSGVAVACGAGEIPRMNTLPDHVSELAK